MAAHHRSSADATPICRCRVLYLGSSVPHITKDGLQGIQEPLRELYPEQGALGARGIDSWLSVWSNGVLLENVDENHKKVTRFFPIDTLHYCAAVRYVLVPEKSTASSSSQPRFLPLDSPFARSPNPNHPPLFACILRRTTGIKVLECHTFICKREMAANALVRCCFHAYADSSYAARQVDPPSSFNASSSTYGTLRKDSQIGTSSNSIEKVDGWRRMTSPMSGSTLTLDSAVHNSTFTTNNNNTASLVFNNDFSRSNDDISIYNGDENHKIWAGSTRELSDGEEGIYGEYGTNTMKSGRSSRPRQIMSATPPPPPPPNKEEKNPNKPNKDMTRRKKMTGGSKEEMYPLMNGSLMRPGSTIRSQGSTSGTLMRGGGGGYHQQQPMVVVPATIPHLRRPPPPKGRLPHPPHLPPTFHPLPPPPPIFVQTTGKKNKHYPVTMEEPIYMPSNRPMSPVSSYQPCHFPIEAYLMQHYATMNYNYARKGKKNKKAMKMIPIMPPPPPNCEEWGDPSMIYDQRPPKEMKNGKPKPPNAGSEEEGSESPFNSRLYNKEGKEGEHYKKGSTSMGLEEDGESPYNTGIYRRKGHMNERAFSYSIRQEHRSRSYGSLANLKFAPIPVLPGDRPDAHYYDASVNKEEMKKEREIMQMMQDLELSGDDIERSEVPPNVYQQTRQRNSQIRR